MDGIPQEHFKPYVPNPATKLGRTYLYAVKDCDGPLLTTEAAYLRDNPVLWLRAISLYQTNMDFLIRQAKTRLKALAPKSGEVQTSKYIRFVRDHKSWSLVQEHKLNKVKSRRAELVVELGFQHIRDVLVVGDMVAVLTDVLAAIKQEDWIEAQRLTEYWIGRLTGLEAGDDEQAEQVPGEQEVNGFDALSSLLAMIRGGEGQ